ncbi:hypothetical protein D3C85_1531500 [compost metagenome]
MYRKIRLELLPAFDQLRGATGDRAVFHADEVVRGAIGANENHTLCAAHQQLLLKLPVVVRTQVFAFHLGDQ